MGDKFLTTQNKKIMASIALGIAGWFVLTTGANPLNLPAIPGIVTAPIFGGFTLLTVAGIITLFTIYLVWTEY